jgi:NTP pyrophosphatase (non-canonical NTP hydrolase)
MSVDVLELRDRIDAACDRYAATLTLSPSDDWLVLKTVEEAGELVQAFLRYTGRARDGGAAPAELRQALDDEVANPLGFALVLSKRFDVDVLAALERKWHLPEHSLR